MCALSTATLAQSLEKGGKKVAPQPTKKVVPSQPAKVPMGATSGAQAKARIGSQDGATLGVNTPAAKNVGRPAPRGAGNDLCAGAQVITGSSGTVATDTTNSTNTPGDLPAGACFATNVDEWFSWTAPANGNVTFSFCPAQGGSAAYDTALAAHTSCGGTQIICNDDSCGLQSSIVVNATMGTTYLLRVTGFSTARGTGTLGWFQAGGGGGGPANDNCANATLIGDGTTNFDGTNATTDGPQPCGLISNDVWFEYVASCTGNATATTCLGGVATLDSVLAVYTGCGGANLACNDDGPPGCPAPAGFSGSTATFPVTAGTHYWIQVGTFNNGPNGPSQITMSCSLPAGNDNCANALSISGPGPHAFDNSAATTDGAPDPLCLAFGSDQVDTDVWFVWGPAACNPGESVEVTFCGTTGVDTKVAVYDNGTNPAPTCLPGAAVACNDDSCGLQSRVTFAATPGNYYMIRVGTFPGAAGGTGTFNTNCFFVPPPVCTSYNVATDCQDTAFLIAYNITTFAAADSITSANGVINTACIQALYFNNVPVPDGYVVTAYADAGGVPGSIIDTFSQGVDVAVMGPAPTGAVFVGRDVQEWNFVFSRPIPAASGTCVWLEFRNNAAGDTVFQMDGDASNGNLQAAQDLNQNGIYESPGEVVNDDLYVCIDGGFFNNALCFNDPCAGMVPANDDCANAIALSVGVPATADTSCATVDSVTSCSGLGLAPGVWYTVTGTGNTMTVDTCASANYDTALEVYCGGCTGGICVAGNDDFCGLQSGVSFCTAAGETYYVLVHGFGGSTGIFDLTLSDDGTPCSTPPSCTPCTGITCPSGSIPENEVCGDNPGTNGGCNYAAGLNTMYEDVDCNRTICGTSWAAGGTRDTDWFGVTAPASGTISATLTADFPAVVFILDLGTPRPTVAPCGTITLVANGSVLPCQSTTISASGLIPGNDYVVFVAPGAFDGTPCDGNYALTIDQGISCVPCCDFNGDGVINSQDFFDFLIAFFASAPNADFNGDGMINSQDFFDFIVCFFSPPAGCP
ncbi:MAG: GC-type dockerin domain-anchored protein [Phycisphaerales bacterium]